MSTVHNILRQIENLTSDEIDELILTVINNELDEDEFVQLVKNWLKDSSDYMLEELIAQLEDLQ